MISVWGGGTFGGAKVQVTYTYLPPANKIRDKVMFLYVSVILSGGLCMMSLPVLLSGPIFLLGVSVPGPMFLPGGAISVQGGLCRETSPNQKSRRWASYWNAFLFVFFSAEAPCVYK